MARNTDYWRALLGGHPACSCWCSRRASPAALQKFVRRGEAGMSHRSRSKRLQKSFGGVQAVRDVSLRRRRGRAAGADRAERRRQDHLLQHAQRPARARRRQRASSTGATPSGCAPREIWRLRRRPHLPDHRDLRVDDGARERADGAAVASPASCWRPVRPRRATCIATRRIALLDARRHARPGRARLLRCSPMAT